MKPAHFFFQQYPVGSMQNFNYVLGCPQTHQGACFDPAFAPEQAVQTLQAGGYSLNVVFLTHNHWDHIDGLPYLVERFDPLVYVHELDEKPVRKITQNIQHVQDGATLKLGQLSIRVIHTPGHTQGSVCYFIEGHTLVTGDTLFQGNCGRCDLPGGSARQMFESLHGKLNKLDPQVIVYPGHDYGSRPVSTIGYESEHNPTMQAETYEAFIRVP